LVKVEVLWSVSMSWNALKTQCRRHLLTLTCLCAIQSALGYKVLARPAPKIGPTHSKLCAISVRRSVSQNLKHKRLPIVR